MTAPEPRPNRVVGGPHDVFWAGCERGELRMQRCDSCGELQWPVVELCGSCGGDSLTWERLSGRGRLASWCVFEHRYYDSLPVPWVTILVELDEGPLMISNPAGFDEDDMAVGDSVGVAFVSCVDDHGRFQLPVFHKER